MSFDAHDDNVIIHEVVANKLSVGGVKRISRVTQRNTVRKSNDQRVFYCFAIALKQRVTEIHRNNI